MNQARLEFCAWSFALNPEAIPAKLVLFTTVLKPMHHDTFSQDTMLRQLRWRYATKQFDPLRKISADNWKTLEDALILTPSSFGLQPWRFVVITDSKIREALVPFSWGQRQVADCSHFIVFSVKLTVTREDVDGFINRIAEVRGMTTESLATYRQMMVGTLVEGPMSATVGEWAKRQAYIALGNFMTCAALLGIDTCPMEGLDPAKYDEILGLPALGFTTVVACPAGYRSLDDKYAALPKVRFKREDLIEYV